VCILNHILVHLTSYITYIWPTGTWLSLTILRIELWAYLDIFIRYEVILLCRMQLLKEWYVAVRKIGLFLCLTAKWSDNYWLSEETLLFQSDINYYAILVLVEVSNTQIFFVYMLFDVLPWFLSVWANVDKMFYVCAQVHLQVIFSFNVC
jgi:hypothetical protein